MTYSYTVLEFLLIKPSYAYMYALQGYAKSLELDILDVNCRNHLGNTPLHEAMLHAHLKMINYICLHGGDVMATNKQGETMLHMCTMNLRCTKTLLGMEDSIA